MICSYDPCVMIQVVGVLIQNDSNANCNFGMDIVILKVLSNFGKSFSNVASVKRLRCISCVTNVPGFFSKLCRIPNILVTVCFLK